MANMIAQMAVAMLKKLVTEKFMARIVVLVLKTLSQSTANKVDDEICKAVGDALGNPCD